MFETIEKAYLTFLDHFDYFPGIILQYLEIVFYLLLTFMGEKHIMYP